MYSFPDIVTFEPSLTNPFKSSKVALAVPVPPNSLAFKAVVLPLLHIVVAPVALTISYVLPSIVTEVFPSAAGSFISALTSAVVEPIEYSFPPIVTLSPALRSSITNVADFALSVRVPLRPASCPFI